MIMFLVRGRQLMPQPRRVRLGAYSYAKNTWKGPQCQDLR